MALNINLEFGEGEYFSFTTKRFGVYVHAVSVRKIEIGKINNCGKYKGNLGCMYPDWLMAT